MAARILKQASTIVNQDYDAGRYPWDMVIGPELMLAVLNDPDCAPFLASCERPDAAEELRELEAALMAAVSEKFSQDD